MTPELRQLRYLVAIAEEGSVSRAAARLHLAQQSLSQQLAALERGLGVTLVDRDARGARLTDAGAAFLPEARAVLAAAEHAVAVAGRAARGEVGTLTAAFLSTTANHLLPPVVRAFRDAYPDVALRTADVPIADLVAGLRSAEFDVGFSRPPLADDLATRTLLTERVCAVLPDGHPLAGRDELDLADLAGEPWVLTERSSWPAWHRSYDRVFGAAGFEPAVVQRAGSVQNLLGLVAAGVGVTRLSESARSLRRTGVVFVPLRGDTASTELVWRPGAEHRPAVANLLTVATALATQTNLLHTG